MRGCHQDVQELKAQRGPESDSDQVEHRALQIDGLNQATRSQKLKLASAWRRIVSDR